jgi:hypothetical protein
MIITKWEQVHVPQSSSNGIAFVNNAACQDHLIKHPDRTRQSSGSFPGTHFSL